MRKRNWKLQSQIDQIKPFLNSSKSILIAAGAGIGVDSGLPDFRGQDGFWKAYPPLAKLGLKFEEMANPRWFYDDPHLAWGFYGHRFGSYKSTIPHAGFSILKKWGLSKESFFVFTSNVDGQFQSAGFPEENIFECHGSIHFLQCLANCGQNTWPFPHNFTFNVDENTFLAEEPLPLCHACGSIARPNILMFSDHYWESSRADKQRERFKNWVHHNQDETLVVVEIGAGMAVPTVRMTCENLIQNWNNDVRFIRINPRETESHEGVDVLKMGALDGLTLLDE